jgi:sulfite reductase (NADPH) hemoprotein beta-component
MGRYNLYLGGDHEGLRLNSLYKENVDEAAILEMLDSLFGDYVAERERGESFGDFTVRKGLVAATENRVEYFSLSALQSA